MKTTKAPYKNTGFYDADVAVAAEPVMATDVENTGMTLHIQRTITDHIPIELGDSGPSMTIGQIIDEQMTGYAKANQQVSFLELEVSAKAWHQYIAMNN